MATTTTGKSKCITCGKDRSAVRCEGCLQIFCYNHLTDHRQELNRQLDDIEVNRDMFRETLTQQTIDLEKHSLIKHINEWEENSIKKIQQTAEESRKLLIQYTTEYINEIEVNLNKLTEELRQTRQENDFNEIDLIKFKDKLTQLTKELEQPSNISIQEDSSLPVNKISVVVSSGKELQQQQQLDQSHEEQNAKNELLQNEIELLRTALNEMNTNQRDYMLLKTSYDELLKRCIEYQQNEIEVKRQLAFYENHIKDLQRKIQNLTKELSAGIEKYKILSSNYTALQRRMELNHHKKNQNATTTLSNESECNAERSVTHFRNLYKHPQERQRDQEEETTSTRSLCSEIDFQVHECPMCYWSFPQHLTLDAKREHIERHFQ